MKNDLSHKAGFEFIKDYIDVLEDASSELFHILNVNKSIDDEIWKQLGKIITPIDNYQLELQIDTLLLNNDVAKLHDYLVKHLIKPFSGTRVSLIRLVKKHKLSYNEIEFFKYPIWKKVVLAFFIKLEELHELVEKCKLPSTHNNSYEEIGISDVYNIVEKHKIMPFFSIEQKLYDRGFITMNGNNYVWITNDNKKESTKRSFRQLFELIFLYRKFNFFKPKIDEDQLHNFFAKRFNMTLSRFNSNHKKHTFDIENAKVHFFFIMDDLKK